MITPANLQYFFAGLTTTFGQAFMTAPPQFSTKIATTVPSSTEFMVYGWMDKIDKMRVWNGSRVTREPAPQTYLVANVPFELTVGIDQFKLEDDQAGIYFPIAAQMGVQAAKLADYQLRDLIQNTGSWTGAYQIGLDGLTHWNTAHPVDIYDASKGTYYNDYSGGPTINSVATGGALSPQGLLTVQQDMMTRKAQDGEVIGVIPDLLWVPPQLDGLAKTLLQAQFFAPQSFAGAIGAGTQVGAMENVALRGSSDLLMSGELNSQPTTWYQLMTRSTAMKPFTWQLRQGVQQAQRIAPTDPVVWDTHTYLFGAVGRGAPAWGQPFLSSKSAP
jgi:phage major head subunit gpT-like protein